MDFLSPGRGFAEDKGVGDARRKMEDREDPDGREREKERSGTNKMYSKTGNARNANQDQETIQDTQGHPRNRRGDYLTEYHSIPESNPLPRMIK